MNNRYQHNPPLQLRDDSKFFYVGGLAIPFVNKTREELHYKLVHMLADFEQQMFKATISYNHAMNARRECEECLNRIYHSNWFPIGQWKQVTNLEYRNFDSSGVRPYPQDEGYTSNFSSPHVPETEWYPEILYEDSGKFRNAEIGLQISQKVEKGCYRDVDGYLQVMIIDENWFDRIPSNAAIVPSITVARDILAAIGNCNLQRSEQPGDEVEPSSSVNCDIQSNLTKPNGSVEEVELKNNLNLPRTSVPDTLEDKTPLMPIDLHKENSRATRSTNLKPENVVEDDVRGVLDTLLTAVEDKLIPAVIPKIKTSLVQNDDFLTEILILSKKERGQVSNQKRNNGYVREEKLKNSPSSPRTRVADTLQDKTPLIQIVQRKENTPVNRNTDLKPIFTLKKKTVMASEIIETISNSENATTTPKELNVQKQSPGKDVVEDDVRAVLENLLTSVEDKLTADIKKGKRQTLNLKNKEKRIAEQKRLQNEKAKVIAEEQKMIDEENRLRETKNKIKVKLSYYFNSQMALRKRLRARHCRDPGIPRETHPVLHNILAFLYTVQDNTTVSESHAKQFLNHTINFQKSKTSNLSLFLISLSDLQPIYKNSVHEDLSYLVTHTEVKLEEYYNAVMQHMEVFCKRDVLEYSRLQVVHRHSPLNSKDNIMSTLEKDILRARKANTVICPSFYNNSYFLQRLGEHKSQMKSSFDSAHFVTFYEILKLCKDDANEAIFNFDIHYFSGLKDTNKEARYMQMFTGIKLVRNYN